MQESIARQEKLYVNKICFDNKFSFILDESTDVSVNQILAIVIRYYDEQKRKTVDALLESIEEENASGKGLYTAVKNFFTERNIPLAHIIGFASYCSAMIGVNSGF